MMKFEDIEYTNYDELRQYGLQYIQKVGHMYWSDYNVHDPGITFLEALCFSLVDLGYRTSFPMSDLLTSQNEQGPILDGTMLFPAHEILSFNPTTITDYRKFVLEYVPGVRNVTISVQDKDVFISSEKRKIQVKGYYHTVIELESDVSNQNIQKVVRRSRNGRYVKNYENDFKNIFSHYVKNQLLKHRNLCEDFLDVEVSTAVPVALCLELELDDSITSKDFSENNLCQQIYNLVSEYVTPHINYHTISELQKKGKTPKDIFQGIQPRLGFIDPDELAAFDKRTVLHVSDVLPLLLGIEGVKGVRHIHFLTREQDKNIVEYDKSYVKLTKTNIHHFILTPYFHSSKPEHNPYGIENELLLNKNWYQFYANPTKPADTCNYYNNYQKNLCTSLPPIIGKHRNTSEYHSFQQLLPQCYHVNSGSKGVLENSEHQISKLQLKGYFSFFDQLLSDYLAQLEGFKSLFSTNETTNIESTYFHHHLNEQEICDINMVLQDYQIGYAEDDTQALDRKNRLLNHLIARFNDSFADYAALQFVQNQCHAEEFDLKENIEDKKRFLKHYPVISGNRAQAQDYTETWAYSGIECRILSRLGLNNLQRDIHLTPKSLKSEYGQGGIKFYNNCSDPFEQTFGLHIIEHNLLVPADYNLSLPNISLIREDNPQQCVDDPYSFRVSVVLPGWLDICQSISFRTYVEQVIREELPAHLVAKICWIAPDVMQDLEMAYEHYLDIMKQCDHPMANAQWKASHKTAVNELACVLNRLVNIYPEYSDKMNNENHIDGEMTLDFCTLKDGNKNGNPWMNLFENKK